MPFKRFALRGNYKQEVRKGYQLIDFSLIPGLSRATYSFENDTITAQSSNETTAGQVIVNFPITEIVKNNPSQTLKFACENIDFSNSNGGQVQLNIMYNNETSNVYYPLASETVEARTYKLPADTSNIERASLKIIVNSSSSEVGLYSLTITKPKFYFGTEEKEYEAYGVAPSVGYPSEIEVVGDSGSVNEIVCNKNLFGITEDYTKTQNGITVTLNEDTATDYVAHEKQTITMPCQQPMVGEEDYFDWENEKEVHGWAKYTFTGQENFELLSSVLEGTSRFVMDLANVFNSGKSNDTNIYTYSNFFKGASWVGIYSVNKTDKDLIANYNDGNYPERHRIVIRIDNNTASTIEELKAWLAEKYTAGNPVYVWYKLASLTELPFTEQQKAVAAQIKALHGYKNVTHIFSTDQVPAIADVTYYKDLETVINNNKQETETRLEAIETLLSTTETSALLLDNYETDLESEVNEI